MKGHEKMSLVMDIECYVDYFLVMFRSVTTGATRKYEQFDGQRLNHDEIRQIMSKYKVVTFNGNNYDLPMLEYALLGATCAQLKQASDTIIVGNLKGWQFEQQHNLRRPRDWDHIDLIEVAPGQASLKLYGGRLHSRKLQDLPIEPSARISAQDRESLALYCANDLQTTIDLLKHLMPQIELREKMGIEYGQDLRSKSDAQIAEAVIKKQVSEIIGAPVQRPRIPPGTAFKYQVPGWLTYTSETMNAVLRDVRETTFFVSADGGVTMPAELDGRTVAIGGGVYRMGIGGLHSSEQCQGVVCDGDHVLVDRDVTSYYPAIILGENLSPIHLREKDAFIRVYRSIVERRVAAKKAGDKVVADALKITANGSFGKLGSRYSTLYSPHLMIQVTLTGQLALLMLIESLTAMCGVKVISANTDGIVIHHRKDAASSVAAAVATWEKATGFNTEDTHYQALFSRDVNNYVALKVGGGTKGKGAFAPPSISKNPQNRICVDAVLALLDSGVPIEKSIYECRDIRKFVTVRTVRGGGVQITNSKYDDTLTPAKKRAVILGAGWFQTVEGPLTKARFAYNEGWLDYDVETAYRMHCGEDGVRYLGKVVRFYIGHSSIGAIYYKDKNKSGGRNKVPESEGAVPVMELPDELPPDINYQFYIREAYSILNDIGASESARRALMYGDNADLF